MFIISTDLILKFNYHYYYKTNCQISLMFEITLVEETLEGTFLDFTVEP